MKVISKENLPSRLPFFSTLAIVTALSHWQAPEWVWGVVLTIVVIWWIGAIVSIYRQEYVNVFDKIDGKDVFERKSKFQQKLEESLNELTSEDRINKHRTKKDAQ